MGRGGDQVQTAQMGGMSMYHLSGSHNQASIAAYGLEARCEGITHTLKQPTGVYFYQSLRAAQEEAQRWLTSAVREANEDAVDIWEISLVGIDISPDPRVARSWYSAANIPAGNLRLAASLPYDS